MDGEIRYSRAFVSPLEGTYVDDEGDPRRLSLAEVLGKPGDDKSISSPSVGSPAQSSLRSCHNI